MRRCFLKVETVLKLISAAGCMALTTAATEGTAPVAPPVAAPAVAAPAVAEKAVPLQQEVNRLETLLKKGTIGRNGVTRLAELYFLTSRCDDIKLLAETVAGQSKTPTADEALLNRELSLLVCACGKACGDGVVTAVHKIDRFRKVLEEKKSWSDPGVQNLWRDVQESPEARYWAVKWLRKASAGDVSARRARLDLEKSLERLEVK